MFYDQPELVHSWVSNSELQHQNANKNTKSGKQEKSTLESYQLKMLSTNGDGSNLEEIMLSKPTPMIKEPDDTEREEQLHHKRKSLQKEANGSVSEDDLISIDIEAVEVVPQSSPSTAKFKNQFEHIQIEAIQRVKSFGNYLYSAVNKVGQTVVEASSKIRKAVNEAHILQEFNKEQDAFSKSLSETTPDGVPPWSGCINEETAREQCLNLSTDRRNFVHSPPDGVNFKFNFNQAYPSALAVMKEDPDIEKMRFDLVPKIVNEEAFWRNYFYRVDLICKANDINTVLDAKSERCVPEELVSDTLQSAAQDLMKLRDDMQRISLESKRSEEDWENELETELQSFEVIKEIKNNQPLLSRIDSNLEHEIEEILKDEHTQ